MRLSKIFCRILWFLLLPCFHAKSQTLQTKIDSVILKQGIDRNGPGGVFLVAHNAKPIYQKAFGKANLELDVDLGIDNVFELGSLTKQFTAVAILQLEEQNKLSISDPISKYLPDYPGGNKITIHHLLTHTSGIKDFTQVPAINNMSQKEMTPLELIHIFKNEPFDFAPGEKFSYNNSGYVLLGYIIEVVSGETYSHYITTHIFQKVGMDHSYYANNKTIIPKRAYGYQRKKEGYINKRIISYTIPYASGALMSTIADMLKWQNAINHNTLLGPKEVIKAFNNYQLNDGTNIGYGYGWHIHNVKGRTLYEHGGNIFGFKSMCINIPSLNVYVLGLMNCDCISPTQLIQTIANIVINDLEPRHRKQ